MFYFHLTFYRQNALFYIPTKSLIHQNYTSFEAKKACLFACVNGGTQILGT